MNTQVPEMSNAFARTLSEFNDGKSLSELSELQQKLIAAVRDTGKGGEVVYKFKVKPASTASDSVICTDEISVKLPKENRHSAIFFITDQNTLSRDNPKQATLAFREVAKQIVAQDAKDLAAEVAPKDAVNQ